jgi:hypothetical protein
MKTKAESIALLARFFFVISFFQFVSHAQSDSTYFPLQKGNTWQYSWADKDCAGAEGFCDVLLFETWTTVTKSFTIKNKTYYELKTYGDSSYTNWFNFDTLYQDDHGSMYRYSNSGDKKWFDFSDTLPYQFSPKLNNVFQEGIYNWSTLVNDTPYSLQVSFAGYSDSIKVVYSEILGRLIIYNSCYTFKFFDAQRQEYPWDNRSHVDYFARGVGLVKSKGVTQGSWDRVLMYAKINGQIVYIRPTNHPGQKQNTLLRQSSNIHPGIYSTNGRKLMEDPKKLKRGIHAPAGIYLDPAIGIYSVK